MKAIWDIDYDMQQDKCYDRPCCPECNAPIGKYKDGLYHCYSCGEVVDVTNPDMINWLRVREETKTEYSDCVCGGKNCMETHYTRNPITLKWQVMGGQCSKCGMRFMV